MNGPTNPPITLRQIDVDALPIVQSLYETSRVYFLSHSGRPAQPEQAALTYQNVLESGDRVLLGIWWERKQMVGCFDLRFDHPAPGVVWFGALILADVLPTDRHDLAAWAVRILEEWLRIGTPTREIRLAALVSDRALVRFWTRMGYQASDQAIRHIIDGKAERLIMFYKRLAARLAVDEGAVTTVA